MSNTYTLEHSIALAGLLHSSVFHKHHSSLYDIRRDTEIAVEPTTVLVLNQHPIITKYNVPPNHSCSQRRKEASARAPVAY